MFSNTYIKMGAVVAAAAAVGVFSTFRFQHAGAWLPDVSDTAGVPGQVGAWTATAQEVAPAVRGILGYPLVSAYEYKNPLGETVYLSLVAAGPFENYHDPTVCVADNGFTNTAKEVFALPGANGQAKVRALVFKRGDGLRILMYYWQQTRDGQTSVERRMGNYRDVAARLSTGWDAVGLGKQVCIVRIYNVIDPADEQGRQAQRNLNEVSVALFKGLKADGEQGK